MLQRCVQRFRTDAVAFAAVMSLALTACGPADQVAIDDPAVVERPGVEVGHDVSSRFVGLDPTKQPQPHSAQVASKSADSASPYTWTAPDHWQEVESSSSMRLVTYEVPSVEDSGAATLSVLSLGGGVRPNIDRWRGQFQLPPYSDDEFATLEMVEALEAQAPIVELRGAFSDSMNNLSGEDFMLLGAVIPLDDHQQIFIKLVGPTATVEPEGAAFRAFVQSFAFSETEP